MLDFWIIEKLKEKEHKKDVQIPLYVPIPDDINYQENKEKDEEKRGIIVIDL